MHRLLFHVYFMSIRPYTSSDLDHILRGVVSSESVTWFPTCRVKNCLPALLWPYKPCWMLAAHDSDYTIIQMMEAGNEP